MVIVMNMSSGRIMETLENPTILTQDATYSDEVLGAGWVHLPRVEPRLVSVSEASADGSELDAHRFMAAMYAAQE